jgi:DNA-binding CsgD family transcriptional regulator
VARTGVSAADVEALVGAADSLAGLDSLQLLRRRAVEIVAELVEATLVAWNEVDLAGRQIDAVASPALTQFSVATRDRMEAAFMEHVADHPVISYYQRTRDGRPYAISDFLSAAAFHQTGIYRHFYRYLGAEDQLSFVLPDPFVIIGVALNRRRRGFSARDRQVCNLLRPHLLQAYRNVEAAARMKRMASAFQLAAAERGLGFIRLDGDGRPSETSASATSILHRFFAFHSTPGLPQEIAEWLDRDRRRTGPAELILYRRDGRRLVVHRAPAAEGDLLLLSEHSNRPLDTRKLGLTAREAQVLALVGEGLATKRIASAIGISPRTVDKHVQHALDKLGVRTRVQAIALMDQAAAAGESPIESAPA